MQDAFAYIEAEGIRAFVDILQQYIFLLGVRAVIEAIPEFFIEKKKKEYDCGRLADLL